MYDVRLINPLRQYGTVCWTLLFEDPAGGLPSLRIDKKYEETASQQQIVEDVRATLVNGIFEATRPPLAYGPTPDPILDEEGNVIYQPEPELLPQGDGVTVDLTGETVLVDDIGGVTYQWQL